MLASVIIGHVRDIYNDKDASSYRIADATIIACINQARRQVVKAIPSRFRTLRSVKLVAGALQTVPDDCAYNFGPTRNMGEDGATAGAVIRQVDRAALDACAPLRYAMPTAIAPRRSGAPVRWRTPSASFATTTRVAAHGSRAYWPKPDQPINLPKKPALSGLFCFRSSHGNDNRDQHHQPRQDDSAGHHYRWRPVAID